MRRGGFTLVEVMVALGIAAIVLSAGIAPLLYSARMMNAARENFAAANRERTAANRIFADVRSAAGLNGSDPVVIAPWNALETGDNDFLVARSLTTTNTVAPLTSVVWGVPAGSALRGDFAPGLYRWVLSDDEKPSDVAARELDPENGALIAPGAESVTFAVPGGEEWKREHRGGVPKALRITFKYSDREVSYEELMPNF